MYQVLQDVLPYFVVFYLVDGLASVHRHQLLFVSYWGGWFRPKRPGLRLVGFLPTAEVVVAFDPPLVVSASGLHVLKPVAHPPEVPGAEDFRLLRYDEIGPIGVDGREVRSGTRRLLAAPSPAGARHLASWVSALKEAGPESRERVLAALLASSTDLDAVRELRKRQVRFVPLLRLLSVALFTGFFVVLPVSLYTEWPARPDAAVVLLALVPLHVTAVILSVRTLRGCGASRGTTLNAVLPMLFFPPSSSHVLSSLLRELYAAYEPLTLAAALLDPGSFREMARRELHRLAVLQERSRGTEIEAFWTRRGEAWGALLARLGTSAAAVAGPPPKGDPAAAAYCPLCAAEYRDGFSTCVDCGAALKAFEA